jgi:pSer/pThr/pTyr-binding forkhead associated (FHA) protein
MSKLTITFKDIPLQSIELAQGEVGIGRDPTNLVHIDSLALADFHATVKFTAEGYVISKLQTDYPIFLNGRQISRELLSDGDHIIIGKHDLYFVQEAAYRAAQPDAATEAKSLFRSFEGSFQVMTGKRIGMVIPLKLPVTQIGKGPNGLVVVAKSEQGYSILTKDDETLLTVNGAPLQRDQEALLQDGDVVRINSSLLQFFQK